MAVISKVYTKVLAALLAWLGFSGTVVSCNGNGVFGSPSPEYGVPSATFKVRGVVVSDTDSTPIQGIRAVLSEKSSYESEENFYEIGGAVFSNNSGNFNVAGASFPRKEILYVKLTDVDGDENGLFADKVVEADFRNVTFTGGSGNWYEGQAEINLGTIKMIPDDNTPE